MLRPIGERVLVEPSSPEDKSKGGILLSSQEEKQDKGTIISVGDGEEIQRFKAGDVIIYEKYGPAYVTLDDKKYVIICIDEILGRMG